MKIATFNVNSLRKRLPIVVEWLREHQPDVLCLQETKVEDRDFPLDALKSTGYHVCFRGMKTFNGVATLTREKPSKVIHGLDEGPDGDDFRILQTIVNGLPIINTYVPNGTSVGTDKFERKLKWFERLQQYFEKHLSKDKPALWLGDMNIAPEPIDVYAPKAVLMDPCFHPDARAAYQRTLAWGFHDVFRTRYPDRVQYTYWDFFRQHFSRNRGWRLDHLLATAPLNERCVRIEVDDGPRKKPSPSDHTVVWGEFQWP